MCAAANAALEPCSSNVAAAAGLQQPAAHKQAAHAASRSGDSKAQATGQDSMELTTDAPTSSSRGSRGADAGRGQATSNAAGSTEQEQASAYCTGSDGPPGEAAGTSHAPGPGLLQQEARGAADAASAGRRAAPGGGAGAGVHEHGVAGGKAADAGEYSVGMQEVDELQNKLFEEEMERLQAVKRADEVEQEVTGKMDQLQDASKEMGVWEDTMGTLQLELESVIMRLANLKEQLRCKEEERDDILNEAADLEDRAVQKEEQLRALGQLLKDLEEDPDYVVARPGRNGLLKGFSLFSRKGSGGSDGPRMVRKLSNTWSADITELSPSVSEEWHADEGGSAQ